MPRTPIAGHDMVSESPWKEECGVTGIFDTTEADAAPLVHIAVYALQHRGQESAGIAALDGDRMTRHRGMGLVSQVFDAARLGELPGHVAIGHVRYATMGSARIENAQPFVVPSPWGPVAIAHNGNLINAPALRRELEPMGVQLYATTDSEMIAHLIARAPAATLEDAIAYCMTRIEGAYTVAAIAGGRLYGFPHPYPIPPLLIGRGPGFWSVASETCAFDHTGAEAVCDVEPGELAILDRDGLRTRQVLPV